MKFSLENIEKSNKTTQDISAQVMAILKREVEQPDKKLISLVVNQQFNINTPLNDLGENALMVAVGLGDQPLVELIVNLDADITLLDMQQQSALAKAALKNNKEMVDFLIKFGATCSYTDNEFQQTNFIETLGTQLTDDMYAHCLEHFKENETLHWMDILTTVILKPSKFQLAHNYIAFSRDSYNLRNKLLRIAIEQDAADACAILFHHAGNSSEIWANYSEIKFFREKCGYKYMPISYAVACNSLKVLRVLVAFKNSAINSNVEAYENKEHIGETNAVAMAANNNNLAALEILLSSHDLVPTKTCNAPDGLKNTHHAFAIAVKRGHHQAAKMLVLHPNFEICIQSTDLADAIYSPFHTLVKARELSKLARQSIIKSPKESQRLFQEALNLFPEVVYNDTLHFMATNKSVIHHQQLISIILQCNSNSQCFRQLNEYIGIEIYNHKDEYKQAYMLAACLLTRARLSRDADRILLTCYYHIENQTFSPTEDSLGTLLLNSAAREVILRAHIQVKLFANQNTGVHKPVSESMLNILASEITDPILLMDFCVENAEPNASDGKFDIEEIYQHFLKLTASKPTLSILANSLSGLLENTTSNAQNLELRFIK